MKTYIVLVVAAACINGALFLAGVQPLAATFSFFGVIAFGMFLKWIKN